MDDSEVYTTADLARILRVQPNTINKYRKSGELVGFWFGRGWRFTGAEVKRMLEHKHTVRHGA